MNHYTLQSLCPYSCYTITLRTTDTRANKTSAFSDIYEFCTEAGNPTEPRNVQGIIIQSTKQLIITWINPRMQNGIITRYEVRWSFTKQCFINDTEVNVVFLDSATSFEVIQPINELKNSALFVCVRAITEAGKFGQWGFSSGIMASGLGTQSNDDCHTLTIVACIAAVAVAASVLMSIILAISICQNGGLFKSKDNDETEEYSKNNY